MILLSRDHTDDKGHIVPNGSNDVRHLMMMTDYVQLFVFVFHRLWIKLYGFANFVEQHLMPYEYLVLVWLL